MEIKTKRMGSVWIASCGEIAAIGVSEGDCITNLESLLIKEGGVQELVFKKQSPENTGEGIFIGVYPEE